MACKRSPVRSRLPPPTDPQSPSSRGLGHRPFTAVTWVRIPVGTPLRYNPRQGVAWRPTTSAGRSRAHHHARQVETRYAPGSAYAALGGPVGRPTAAADRTAPAAPGTTP